MFFVVVVLGTEFVRVLAVFVVRTDVFVLRVDCMRVLFLTVSATAPSTNETAKHAANKMFRPFISSFEKMVAEFLDWWQVFLSKYNCISVALCYDI